MLCCDVCYVFMITTNNVSFSGLFLHLLVPLKSRHVCGIFVMLKLFQPIVSVIN